MDHEIFFLEQGEKAFEEYLRTKIKEFNNARSLHHQAAHEPGAVKPLNIVLRDSASYWIGGLTASTYWGWLEIEDLYIPEPLRGQGVGAAILQKAEEIAVQRGCNRAFLSTFEFQARGFYEKQGYSVTGTLDGYPPGSAYYWMAKDLTPDSNS